MCGIWYGPTEYIDYFEKLRHRGPDATNVLHLPNGFSLGFHRLAINDQSHRGMQPFYSTISTSGVERFLICNGEIYNHQELRDYYMEEEQSERSDCDCSVILPLIEKLGYAEALKEIRGEYAMVIVELQGKETTVFAARDLLGVRPLFYNKDLCIYSSEAKGIPGTSTLPYPPGHSSIHFEDYFQLDCSKARALLSSPPSSILSNYQENKLVIRRYLSKAVRRRIPRDPDITTFGCLLSGGLDSSIVAALATMYAKEYSKKLEIFTIYIDEDSPDLLHARRCCEYIGMPLNEIKCSVEEVYAALNDCIYSIESYDTTTVRASVMQYLGAKHIAARGDIKVVLCGEVSDELFQGYLYFHKQPSVEEGAEESRRLLQDIYMYDGLRTDRTMARWGLEVRLPFSDEDLVKRVLSMKPSHIAPCKGIEKYILRDAFQHLLPSSITWRRKEAFSDAVSHERKSLFHYLQEHIEKNYSCTEAAYYRKIYDLHYGEQLITYLWMPKWSDADDPSARTLSYYNK